MENVFDIKFKQKLEYILSSETKQGESLHINKIMDKVAIVVYFYYIDTVDNYCEYIDNIQQEVKVYVITPQENVAQKVKNVSVKKKWSNVEIIMKPNRGRDVSGLLIAAKSVVDKYKYICFIHDKKAHFKETEDDVALWIQNMWENLVRDLAHVHQIINIFEENKRLGVLVPPAPVGKVFKVWYGYGWRGCFETTKQLARMLNLNCDLDEKKPPITIGTTFWFRREALQKLFDYNWKYEDFDDDELMFNNYLSYAVERIFAYVAQDAGYVTGEVMTTEYARIQTLFLQYSLSEIFRKMQPFYPFPTYENALCIDNNLQQIEEYLEKHKAILIYGVNDIARFCASYIRKLGHEPESFLIEETPEIGWVDNVPVSSITTYSGKLADKGIIITASSRREQEKMAISLKNNGANDYCVFLQEAR